MGHPASQPHLSVRKAASTRPRAWIDVSQGGDLAGHYIRTDRPPDAEADRLRLAGKEPTMKRLAAATLLAAIVLATALPVSAQQPAYTMKAVHLRAGPARDYPVVAVLPAGLQLSVLGCLSDYSWCDVVAGVDRGWVYARNIAYPYQGAAVPVLTYGAQIGIAIVGFALLDYWALHYHERPFYRDRDRWVARPRPPQARPPVAVGPAPPMHRPPAGEPSRPRPPGDAEHRPQPPRAVAPSMQAPQPPRAGGPGGARPQPPRTNAPAGPQMHRPPQGEPGRERPQRP
jgi:uncharacterized protein YraI